ncbi:hypothetical protein HJG54_34270 [Leptolyngbya sp. NK1-12]|uniref:Uncharacterized protein n=1 Tax=Leptolyngbya sp. NK1-12 TaxID=2547451 RepID=A0AA97AJQ4_9CYAN|nr:hypothetical protein [Leptolyngbya sp. NK1-12]WNZ26894.1 hypothetical protein HJG54_28625 [Leptolyngbya sp. NK1-12]WNZ27892.1 hypothetical protein HJG54_34270 [Leptolyngbya sp. NK1-12]
MSQCSSILPGLPNTKAFNDLRFQIKALRSELMNLGQEVEELARRRFCTPEDFLSLRYQLSSISAGLEHVVSFHYAELLRLIAQLFNEQALLAESERLSQVEIDWDVRDASACLDRLHKNLQQLATTLQVARNELQQLAQHPDPESQGVKPLAPRLARLTEMLVNQGLLACQTLLGQAVQFHRDADPVAAAAEDYWAIVDTPLREEHHPAALQLAYCPYCGAKLTSEDRSFDGSYCENCRTRWIQTD